MKVKLLRNNRIDGKAGEIVEVSPDRAAFLIGFSMAEPVAVREQIEAPEKKMAARATRKAEPETAEPEKKTTRRRK